MFLCWCGAGVLVSLRDGVRLSLPLRLRQPSRHRELQAAPPGGLSVLLHDYRTVVVHGEWMSLSHHNVIRRFLLSILVGMVSSLHAVSMCGL